MGRPGEQAEDRGGEQGPPRPRQPGSTRTADQLDTPANPTNLTPNAESEESNNQPPPEGAIPPTRLRASTSAAASTSGEVPEEEQTPVAEGPRYPVPPHVAFQGWDAQQPQQAQATTQPTWMTSATAAAETAEAHSSSRGNHQPPPAPDATAEDPSADQPTWGYMPQAAAPPNLAGRASRQQADATAGGTAARAAATEEGQAQQPHPANTTTEDTRAEQQAQPAEDAETSTREAPSGGGPADQPPPTLQHSGLPPLTEPTPDSNRPERATPHQPPAQAAQPRHPDHLPNRGGPTTAAGGGYPTGEQWQSHQPPHQHGTHDAHPGTDTDTGSAASQQQQQHRSGKRKEGQGPVRTAHRERKEWIKEQFRLHGLHKPSHHTWTQAEDQLMRYLKGRAEHVPGSKPTVQVDIGAVLRSQTEWATTAPARGTKADTAADPPYHQQQQQQGRQQQATSRGQQQQPPKEEPAQQSSKQDKRDDQQQPADDTTKEDKGHPPQHQQPNTSRDQQRQAEERSEQQHTRPEASRSDPTRPAHNTTRHRGHPPRQHQQESNWNVAPAFTWREGDTRLQLYLPPNEGTPLTYPPVLPVGPTMAIVYQSMPAGIWLAASIRQKGHSPPLPPPHDGATVVASKTNPLDEGNQFFLGMGVSIFMRGVGPPQKWGEPPSWHLRVHEAPASHSPGALKFTAGDQALITKRDGRWKWQLYTYEALQELGGYTHPLPDTHGTSSSGASSSGATTQRDQQEQAASSSSGAQEQPRGTDRSRQPAAAAAAPKGKQAHKQQRPLERQTHRPKRRPNHRHNNSQPKPRLHQYKYSTQRRERSTPTQQQQETRAKQVGPAKTE